MLCPVCKDTKLTLAERQGVEIDFCPECRGIWLDRSELDKIIERSQEELASRESRAESRDTRDHEHRREYRKKSFLGDLFD